MGEKRFKGVSDEGVARGITVQVCEVSKPLLSVSKLVKAGNRVVFEESGSCIEDIKTGEVMKLHSDGGMYMLKLWVKRGEGF